MHVQTGALGSQKDSVTSPGAGAQVFGSQPTWLLGTQLGPLQQQQVLLTSQPFLQWPPIVNLQTPRHKWKFGASVYCYSKELWVKPDMVAHP